SRRARRDLHGARVGARLRGEAMVGSRASRLARAWLLEEQSPGARPERFEISADCRVQEAVADSGVANQCQSVADAESGLLIIRHAPSRHPARSVAAPNGERR